MNRMALSACSSTLFVSALCLAGIAACSDIVPVEERVTAITITPPSATLNVGDRLTLLATVIAGAAQTNRSVRWTTANATVATVSSTTGEVAAIGGGTTNIVATSVADSTIKAAAAITVGSFGPTPSIAAINQDGKAADLSNVSGRIDVIVSIPAYPPSYSRFDLVINCAGADTVVATQAVAATVSAEQSITLSFNTVAFKNGPCDVKVKGITANGTIVSSSAARITLNNPTGSASSLLSEYVRHSLVEWTPRLGDAIAVPYVARHPLFAAGEG
jgi:hypothetical protein